MSIFAVPKQRFWSREAGARVLLPRPKKERCRSGRSGRTRNAVYGQLYRGFESLPLRQGKRHEATTKCQILQVQRLAGFLFIPVRLPKDPKNQSQASGRLPTVRSTPTSAWFFRRSDRSTAQSAPTGPSVRLSRAFPTTSTFPRPPSRPPGRGSRSPILPVRVSR